MLVISNIMIFSHKDKKKSNPNKHFWGKVTKSKENRKLPKSKSN